jgi:hypothetical protein
VANKRTDVIRKPRTLHFRRPLYALLNLVFVLLVGAGAASGINPNPRLLYVCMLFAVCTSPILKLERLNGTYAILGVFSGLYFLFFGALDVTSIFSFFPGQSAGVLSSAELVILVGGVLVLLGYHSAVRLVQRKPVGATRDWPPSTLLIAGLILWALGTAASWYWQVHVVVRTVEVKNDLSATATVGVLIARTIQPLGVLVLAYCLATFRKPYMLPVMLAVVAVQVVLGFVTDSKETAMHAAFLIIMTLLLVRGRIPKAWVAGAMVGIILAFPVFQAYRTQITGVRHMTNAQAAENIGQVFDIAREFSQKAASGYGGATYKTQSFVERSSLKSNIELILAHAGGDVRYQNGDSILPLLAAFIPRLIWPNKPIDSTGQVFNREFHVSVFRDVYISPSHLGELYWNFGWPGVLFGMPLIGWLLGYVNARCDLSKRTSVTRLLVIATTIYLLCVRFEGSIAVEYVLWLRSLLAVFGLHLLFARVRVKNSTTTASEVGPSRGHSGAAVTTTAREAVRLMRRL